MSHADQLYFEKIKQAGISNTAARYAVFNVLQLSDHKPLTMSQLVNSTIQQADRASVYRSVKLLEEIGVIHRLQIGWKYKLELSDDFHGHHHHITCSICGKTHITHDDDDFELYIQDLARKHGYEMTSHQLDIRGICKNCQKKNPAV